MAYSESSNGLDNVIGLEGHVLNTSADIVVNVFLDLALSLSLGGLIDGELDCLIEVSHDNGANEGLGLQASTQYSYFKDEYSVWISLSSIDQYLWKSRTFSYHWAVGSISCSYWLATT